MGTGGTPDLDVVLAALSVTAAVELEDGLWVVSREQGGPAAFLLGPDLAAVRDVPLAADLPAVARGLAEPAAPRPARARRRAGRDGGPLLPRGSEAGFPEIDALVFEGNVEGFVFDATGERLWVVTRGPDRVVLVD